MREPELHLLDVYLWAGLQLRPVRLRLRQRQLHLLSVHLRTRVQLRHPLAVTTPPPLM